MKRLAMMCVVVVGFVLSTSTVVNAQTFGWIGKQYRRVEAEVKRTPGNIQNMLGNGPAQKNYDNQQTNKINEQNKALQQMYANQKELAERNARLQASIKNQQNQINSLQNRPPVFVPQPIMPVQQPFGYNPGFQQIPQPQFGPKMSEGQMVGVALLQGLSNTLAQENANRQFQQNQQYQYQQQYQQPQRQMVQMQTSNRPQQMVQMKTVPQNVGQNRPQTVQSQPQYRQQPVQYRAQSPSRGNVQYRRSR